MDKNLFLKNMEEMIQIARRMVIRSTTKNY